MIAVVIMLAGTSLVGLTYVFASVPAPTDLPLPGESTEVLFSDGTPMAKIGQENRTIVPLSQIPIYVQQAVIAAEDRTFYDNEGVDFKGIVRAAWNNFTGGEQQGASTITQQYARNVAALDKSASYKRKVKEAVIAMKLADNLTKEDILYRYLNTIYLGRGAYGFEAGAQAYFLKPVDKLTVEEGIVLAGLIKSPDGGKGSPFDRTVNPQLADERWASIRQAMMEIKPTLDKHGGSGYQVTAEMKPPNVVAVDPKSDRFKQQYGLDRPTGHIVHQVMDELSRLQQTDNNIKTIKDLKNGGLKIYTTIDPASQRAAEKYANLASKDSPLFGQPDNLTAALVAVEPYSGRVIAYYGGPKGDGNDYAGVYKDPVLANGDLDGVGFHPPGSTFKVYTLAAGLAQGVSVNSWWDGTSPKDFPGRTGANAVRNAGGDGKCSNGAEHCQLWEATEKSLNVPFYALTYQIGADKVLETARAAGIRYMWNDKRQVFDLNSGKASDFAPKQFNTEIGFGQYPVTVLDHANGIASIAARGNVAKQHFIREVYKAKQLIYAERPGFTKIPGFNEHMADDVAWALQKVAKNNNWNLQNDRKVAAKTGTWQLGDTRDNAHSWTVGYSAAKRDNADPKKNYNGLAVAVWVGNKGDEKPLKKKDGSAIAGSSGAGPIFKAFMQEVSKGKPVGKFPEARFVGDESKGNAESPPPSADPGIGSGGPGGPGGPGGGNGGGNGGGLPGLPTTGPTRRR